MSPGYSVEDLVMFMDQCGFREGKAILQPHPGSGSYFTLEKRTFCVLFIVEHDVMCPLSFYNLILSVYS